ncbi:MAG: GAF domain-containing protein [Calditrichia bacterium]
MGTTFNMNTVIRLILEHCINSIGFDRTILYLIDEQQQYLECTETHGFNAENEKYARRSRYHLERYDCIETRVVREGRIIYVEDFAHYPEATELDKKIYNFTKSNSFVYVPLKVKEKIIGILGADKVRSKNPITQTDINSLQILANQASRVIENTRLYQEVINQRNFVEDIISNMQNGVITINSNGRITSFNRAASKILQSGNPR